jgi:hypothetical protein
MKDHIPPGNKSGIYLLGQLQGLGGDTYRKDTKGFGN